MKRNALYATAGSALALALFAATQAASADVNVFASIQKTKDITITENITITKTVDILVQAINLDYGAAAEADAIVNQENFDNQVDHTQKQLTPTPGQELDNYGIDLTATIDASVNGNLGIVELNQDVGNMANQGNQVALAVVFPEAGADPSVVVNSQSEAEQINQNNQVRHLEDPVDPQTPAPTVNFVTPPHLEADINNSINGNVGIVNVNQNAGNMNNQANSEALAVGIDLVGVALSEAALGQVNGVHEATTRENEANTVVEAGVIKSASISGSINGNVGVGGVNQAVGNNANQANIFSLSFVDGGGGVGAGGPGPIGPGVQ
jgi:hypothetical protein